jgi:CubicO group peptidase (beta-lactamase class C family)
LSTRGIVLRVLMVSAGLAAAAGCDGAPAGVASSPPALEDVGPFLEPIRAEHDLPALAGSIVAAGRTIAIGATGQRARGVDDPVSIHDRWHLGSCTKAMTATLTALLVEDGRLSWETTLADAYPDEVTRQPAWGPATIEMLLRHRSGLREDRRWPDAPWNKPLSGTVEEQRRHVARALLAEAPESAPGSATSYSNGGYMVVGSVLEMRTGASWEDLVRERLFEPLRMESAGFGPPRPLPQPQGHWERSPRGVGARADNPPVLGPAGTVHASLEDWGKFVALHLQGSSRDTGLLPRAAFDRLHAEASGTAYAMGWGVAQRDWGGRVLSHSGSNGFWYAVVWIAPQEDFAVLVVTNEGGDHAAAGTDAAAGALIRHFHATKSQRGRHGLGHAVLEP